MGTNWERYLALMAQRPEAFANQPGGLTIVTHREEVEAFEQKTGITIGVVYESPYHLLVVDLVRQGEGAPFAYERLLPAVPRGAVVTVPVLDGKLVLLRQYRHALRGEQLAFPRGFAEPGLTPEENAAKELEEELGCQVDQVCPLGQVVADSGVDGSAVAVCACRIHGVQLQLGYEGIQDILVVEQWELEKMIRRGEINDGFTLSAYALWKTGRDAQEE